MACLESVFRLQHQPTQVIWCDNASPDGSVDRLVAWAKGDLNVIPDGPPAIRGLLWPPVPKPIRYQVLDAIDGRVPDLPAEDARLIIVRTGGNHGCASGYNVGLRIAQRLATDFVWVLNNDTVVRPDTLTHLLARASEDPTIGMCGSSVFDFSDPDRIQAQGGAAFDFKQCRAFPINYGRHRTAAATCADVEHQLSYILGASMLIRKQVLDEVGLMPAHFFMYFEEIAWAEDMRRRYRLGYAPASEVYHRDGTAIEAQNASQNGDSFRDRELLGNRLLFAWIYRRRSVPFVAADLAFELWRALAARNWARARMIASPGCWLRRSRARDVRR